jgi:hypothetical protein
MITQRRLLTVAALAAVAAVAPAIASGAATRAPIKDCGDVTAPDQAGLQVTAVTAQRTTCRNALAIAGTVARSPGCKRQGFCRRSHYTCLLAKAGKELTFARCEGRNQTAFIRFEFGL